MNHNGNDVLAVPETNDVEVVGEVEDDADNLVFEYLKHAIRSHQRCRDFCPGRAFFNVKFIQIFS